VVKFDGFIKVYRESSDDDEQQDEFGHILPPMKKDQELTRREILATERFSAGPQRYTEASLVKKMEELGIGRPSTYAPTISTIQQRDYVQRGDKKGEERSYTLLQLKGKQVTQKTRKEIVGSEKGKLLPTDIGMVVNDFLMEHFKDIMDYNFTAKVEQDFDKIAEGGEMWTDMMKQFYNSFEPVVEETMNSRQQHKAGERLLGNDPKTGRPVFVKIGRFGPVVQIGSADDREKPLFAQLPKEQSMETITIDEAMELFKLPREIGEYEGKPVTIGAGRFGPYVLHDRQYTSIPKGTDPMGITLDDAILLIQEKRQQDSKKHMKFFLEDPKLEILNGRYGPYLTYDGKNYRLPKSLHEKVTELTYDECMKIIQSTPTNRK
jgi:DNA topoisomerase-1